MSNFIVYIASAKKDPKNVTMLSEFCYQSSFHNPFFDLNKKK
jgi:hypothetical protein